MKLDQAKSGEEDKVDVLSTMARIRERIKADVEANKDKRKSFKPAAANFESRRKAGEILHSEELRYLNTNYAFGPNLNLDSISSHRPGIIGKSIVKVKRKLLSIIWDLLKDYFSAEREFHANLVRLLNDLSKYVDERDASNFWELIKKIDYDVTKALDRIERINDEQMASIRSSERRMFDSLDSSLRELQSRISRLDSSRAVHDAKLETLESVASGLEGIVARLGRNAPAVPESTPDGAQRAGVFPDYSYLMLENRFRGSEEMIEKRQSFYPEIFKGAEAAILEIGPGRCELMQLFKEQGIEVEGIDIDAGMVELAAEKRFNVKLGDGIEYLRTLPESSLGGVIAIQVVEHLKREMLEELCRLCADKVKPGGKIVFETIDPRSLLALSSHYFRDPTHVWPLHPDTLDYIMTLSGLKVLEVKPLSPLSEEAQLRPLPIEDYMTPRWAYTIESLNRNFEQLNNLLYGHMDYCIIAEVRQS